MDSINAGIVFGIAAFAAFWGIMVTRKNGPEFFIFKGGIFKFTRNNTEFIFNCFVIFGVPLTFLYLIYPQENPIFYLVAAMLALALAAILIIFKISRAVGGFLKKIVECSACLTFWISLLVVLFARLDISYIFMSSATAFVLMSLCGVNDLQDHGD